MGIYRAIQFNTQTNLLDITAQFDPSLVYPLTPPQGMVLTASGTLTNGSLVTLVNSGGNIEAVASSASASCSQPALPANGFVLNSYTNGQPVTVFLAGLFTTAVEGATAANVGDLVYLSGASGQVTLTPLLPTSVWSPDTAYIFGQTIIDGNGNYETVTTAGTSGASEPLPTPPGAGSPPTQPVWATTCGGTTVDGSASPPTAVVWKMSPAPLQQVVGTIVYYDAVTGQCTIDFQPLLNVGDVSSVALAMPSDFAVGGSPIVNSGVFMVTWLPQAANTVHAGPATGGSGSVVWRPLVVADIPPLPFSKIISGVNTVAAMVVGAGASLSFSTAGSPPITGVINANELYGVAVSATAPTTGQYLVATGPTSAAWQTQAAVSPGTGGQVAYYAATGSEVSGDSRLTDNGTTLAYTGSGGIGSGSVATTGLISVGTTISSYNGISTVANGIPTIYGKADLAAQTGGTAATPLIGSASAGIWRVIIYLVVTVPDTGSPPGSTLPDSRVIFTDRDSGATIVVQATAGSMGNATTTFASATVEINAKASTSIEYDIGQVTPYASNLPLSMQFAYHARAEFLG